MLNGKKSKLKILFFHLICKKQPHLTFVVAFASTRYSDFLFRMLSNPNLEWE